MSYKSDYGKSNDIDSGMIWDLRQIYAIEILGETLKDIERARKSNDFPNWFKLLKRDLATEINHKLDKIEIKEVKDKITETETVINKNIGTYTNAQVSAESFKKLEDALCNLEKLLKKLMDGHGMFGQKEIDIGL